MLIFYTLIVFKKENLCDNNFFSFIDILFIVYFNGKIFVKLFQKNEIFQIIMKF